MIDRKERIERIDKEEQRGPGRLSISWKTWKLHEQGKNLILKL
jgi:hypothetical protein